MTVKPLQDRVLIKRLEEETKPAGGIIIPDNHKEKPAQGEVISVGTGYRLQDGTVKALEVKKGDKVLFGKYSGTEVKVGGETFVIMKEDEQLNYTSKQCLKYEYKNKKNVTVCLAMKSKK